MIELIDAPSPNFDARRAPPDMLVMTATPIPRTLLLTQWGEMAVSRLTEKPAGYRELDLGRRSA